jgi:sugar phosphate isomerase/epimerase
MLVADVAEKACLLGAQGVELRPELWPNLARERVATRRLCESCGLGVTYATRNPLFSPDAASQRALLGDVDTAAALGSPLLRVFAGQTPPGDDVAGWQGAMQVIEHAENQGIVLALENYVGMPGGTLAEIVHILDRFQTSVLGTNVDIGNYTVRGQDVLEAIHALGHRAVYAHLKDRPADPGAPHAYLGGGAMDLQPLLDALDELPQALIYCLEFPGGGEPDDRIRKSLAYLRDRWEGAGPCTNT